MSYNYYINHTMIIFILVIYILTHHFRAGYGWHVLGGALPPSGASAAFGGTQGGHAGDFMRFPWWVHGGLSIKNGGWVGFLVGFHGEMNSFSQ